MHIGASWQGYSALIQHLKVVRSLLTVFALPIFSQAVCAVQPDIPQLDWQPRSDWINVQSDVKPAAVGDGQSDDTMAIQSALDRGPNGKTIYLPPGTYRITQTLVFHGEGTGAAVIGHGRKTRLVWDGEEGGRMFWSDGIAYSRYVGLSWDGRGRAAVGFDHAADRRFETEVRHEHEAFRNFTGFGIRVGGHQKMASAEILYHNCLFENCGTALGFLTFNDYDNTIDGCEFRTCGIGVLSHKSNFYARNCHFEKSRQADFQVVAEHGCSIRRCTSIGSRRFIQAQTIAPLTIQDCRVAGWLDPDAAVYLQSGPVLMFDCVFTPASSNGIPVKVASAGQKIFLSNNRPEPLARLVLIPPSGQIYEIPPGLFHGEVMSASRHFLQETATVSGKVFDAMRDFGARGDGAKDDTLAIQAAINAARAEGNGAVAYLPTGRYRVQRTLLVEGTNYSVAGSGFNCGLVWRGVAGQPLITMAGVVNVALTGLAVGMPDLGEMNHGDDILVVAKGDQPCRVVLDELFAYGMYQKAPDKHGIHFMHLPSGSVVDAGHLQGNVRVADCSGAQLLFRTSYEGTVTIEGGSPRRDGLLGFLTRVSTASMPALRVCDNQSVVMSDFYNEQSDQIAVLSGLAGQANGRITIQSPKIHLNTASAVFDIHDYRGTVYLGQSQFYCAPKETKFQSTGTQSVQLQMVGNSWYNNRPVFDLAASAKLMLAGNVGIADSADAARALAGLSSALDDLRRLGELDQQLSRPTP